MKILTVTANPCIDRTVWVEALEVGGTNRVSRVSESINGKGINTSIAIKNLGYDTLAIAVEYTDGESVSKYLLGLGIDNFSVSTPGKLRVNTKIFDTESSCITELNCKGSEVDPGVEKKLMSAILERLEPNDVLILSGSVPPGISLDFYKDLLLRAKKVGAYTILDADGELLARGLEGSPDLIKPNREELSRLCGRLVRDIDEAVEEARALIYRGVGSVCISFGGKGALYVTANNAYWADSARVSVKGTVGAGDSMVAGFAIGRLRGLAPMQSFRSAMAVASGSVTLEGTQMCDSKLYEKMLPMITVEELN